MHLLLKRFWRAWHRWIAVLILLPLSVTVLTGLLLITRGLNPWVQPPTVPSSGKLNVSFEQILTAARSVPELKISSWSDVSQIDIRPGAGLIRLRPKRGNVELQIDGESGKVLRTAERNAAWITALHEGSYFGNGVRYGVFLPSALGLLFLLASGLVLFSQPVLARRRARRPKE